MAVPAEIDNYGNVEAFAALVTCAPDSSFSIVKINFFQRFLTFRADVSVSFEKVLFDIHVAAFNVLNQRALLNVKRLAEGTAISNRNVCRITFRTKNDFIVKLSFQDSGSVKLV